MSKYTWYSFCKLNYICISNYSHILAFTDGMQLGIHKASMHQGEGDPVCPSQGSHLNPTKTGSRGTLGRGNGDCSLEGYCGKGKLPKPEALFLASKEAVLCTSEESGMPTIMFILNVNVNNNT